ncbi:MAG: RnfH family protein [Burkholderiaceae bacterium]|nr:RnfH family protein [Burkholderiaceae bacterium]
MADAAHDQSALEITVLVCLAPRQVSEQVVLLARGATVRDVLQAAGGAAGELVQGHDPANMPPVGIWGRAAGLDSPVAHSDRVEVYRPLTVDPKVARRERFAQQGARTTGLFARRRPGGKQGY